MLQILNVYKSNIECRTLNIVINKIKNHSTYKNVFLVLLVKNMGKGGTIADILIKFNTKYLQVLGHYKPAKYLPSSALVPS